MEGGNGVGRTTIEFRNIVFIQGGQSCTIEWAATVHGMPPRRRGSGEAARAGLGNAINVRVPLFHVAVGSLEAGEAILPIQSVSVTSG